MEPEIDEAIYTGCRHLAVESRIAYSVVALESFERMWGGKHKVSTVAALQLG